MGRSTTHGISLCAAVAALALGPAAGARQAEEPAEPWEEDFTELDLEQLMQIEVTTAAGRPQPLLDTPAAIFVITGEEVRRTGHRTLADSLRLVPGFNVAQISPSIWAISARGFQDRFANRLLVLIDGRTVYDPLFSGVFWNVQDVVMEDLDQIEAIRGPGATLWGANAVNGVVNILTKSAEETQGLFVQAGYGNLFQGFGVVRYGGAIDDDTFFRVYGKYDSYDSFEDTSGTDRPTDWDVGRGGFRIDSRGDDDSFLTVQGDIYATTYLNDFVSVPVPAPTPTFSSVELDGRFQGGNLLARVGQQHADDEGWNVQAYYDRTETRSGRPGFEVKRDTIDVEYRQYVPLADGAHVLMWGLGYRHTRDKTSGPATLLFSPSERSLDRFSAFIQDTITLAPESVHLTLGSKFEHNDFTGFEIQPTARLSWMPDEHQTLWGAVSRAVRTPSRTADDVLLTTAFADTGLIGGGPPSGIIAPLVVAGDDDIDSEELLAFELGYRLRATETLSFDVAGFYNDYDEMITFPLPAGTFGNRGEANTYGFELSSTWRVAENWRLMASYSFLKIDFDSPDGNGEESNSPQQQFNLISFVDLTEDLELNSALYFVDAVPNQGADDYVRLDVGVTWRPRPNVEVAFWGQNLLDDAHFEFGDPLFEAVPLEVGRSFYAQVSLRF